MQIAVLGAGYAGLTLARRLEDRLPDAADIVVVDESETHLVQHEVHRVVRQPSIVDAITVPLDEVLDRADVITARVETVDADAGMAELDTGETLDYDYAAVCLGAETAYYGLPGVEEHSTPLKRVADAEQIREDFLDVCETGGTVVVGGAGLSGVQIAGELAALADEEGASESVDVVLLEQLDAVAPNFPENFQEAVHDELVTRSVDVRTGQTVVEATADEIELESGSQAYDQFVWTGGITGSEAMDGDRPTVRNDLRLNRSTFVVGDAARAVDADGEAVPASASAAIREAGTVAGNIAKLVDHDLTNPDDFAPRMKPYRFEVPGWIVSVGDGAVAQVGPTVVRGPAARAMKATVGAGYLGSVKAIKQAAELVREELGHGHGGLDDLNDLDDLAPEELDEVSADEVFDRVDEVTIDVLGEDDEDEDENEDEEGDEF
ncbi:NADH dehydrogenase [Halogranum gelatinilyticum]|uniref:NADH dehydrogenase n=1 Tax=Halogranum gelatinilyticum TaxID=660521 RepID=A0A1G9VLQ6_9EURY|nr:FAD-dependent oxidoreductase [Halogranum gelatinilyticum]SDM73003.1 NADH dehydrogenase [Halogranum gelatinilyticum]